MHDEYLTPSEFADYLGVSRTSLYNIDKLTKYEVDNKLVYKREQLADYYLYKSNGKTNRVAVLSYNADMAKRLVHFMQSCGYIVTIIKCEDSWYLDNMMNINGNLTWLFHRLAIEGELQYLVTLDGVLSSENYTILKRFGIDFMSCINMKEFNYFEKIYGIISDANILIGQLTKIMEFKDLNIEDMKHDICKYLSSIKIESPINISGEFISIKNGRVLSVCNSNIDTSFKYQDGIFYTNKISMVYDKILDIYNLLFSDNKSNIKLRRC